MIHPAVVLTEGHTYVVALRGLVDADGDADRAGAGVRAPIRDGVVTDDAGDRAAPRRAWRRCSTRSADAGIERDDLQLAWDFTVASTENITGRMLHIRDETLGRARRRGAAVHRSTTSSTTRPTTTASRDRARQTSPARSRCRTASPATARPGNRFYYGDAATRAGRAAGRRTGRVEAPFQCNVADRDDGRATEPAHLVQYGHGLLGSERRDRRRQRPRLRQRAQHRVLRHEVGRHERGRHPQRGRHARRLVQLPDDGRPPAAGRAQPARPRPADARRRRARRPTRRSSAPTARR